MVGSSSAALNVARHPPLRVCTFPVIETTSADVFTPPVSSIADVAAFGDARTGSRCRRPEIAVALGDLCPRLLPMMARLEPLIACHEPSERRRSCIRRSDTSARFSSARHRFFGGFMYPVFDSAGNTYPDGVGFRSRRKPTASGTNASTIASLFLLTSSGIVQTAASRFTSCQRIPRTFSLRAPVSSAR
jgi:hypothetical protein